MGEEEDGVATAKFAVSTATVSSESVDLDDPRHDDRHNNSGGDDDALATTAATGTISSARLNLLSSMVGGGSLSLPLAFERAGNSLVAPLVLVVVAASAHASLVSLADASRAVGGADSYESLAAGALRAPRARDAVRASVVSLCALGCVGYCVLARDLASPLARAWSGGGRRDENHALAACVLAVTPLVALRDLTALRGAGAVCMVSVTVLAVCVTIESGRCNVGREGRRWTEGVSLWPSSVDDLLTALPLTLSCYLCHFNAVSVRNELRDPTPERWSRVVRTTTVPATLFYAWFGWVGSMYADCTPDHRVEGNILLDFRDGDHLMMVGRLFLGAAVCLAIPMLVLPARDTILRTVNDYRRLRRRRRAAAENDVDDDDDRSNDPDFAAVDVSPMEVDAPSSRPLLADDANGLDDDDDDASTARTRAAVGIAVLWFAAMLASLVDSVDVVWGLTGSSLTILVGFVLPAACHRALVQRGTGTTDGALARGYRRATVILCAYSVALVVCTAHAVRRTFFAS